MDHFGVDSVDEAIRVRQIARDATIFILGYTPPERFGDVVRRMGMAGALERAGHLLRSEHVAELAKLPPPERVRRALEEMGPSFIKLGQLFATRIDLFAPEWIAEFEKMQSQVPPVPFETIRPQKRNPPKMRYGMPASLRKTCTAALNRHSPASTRSR